MLLLLHDKKYDDYFSKQLIENRNKLSCNLEVLSVDDLLNQCSYEYNKSYKVVLIKCNGKRIFVNDTVLVNRLIRMRASNFDLEGVSSKIYFKYCSSFLSGLVGSFYRFTNCVGESCLSGSYHPLNMQWYLVKNNLEGIATPEFDFSFAYKMNDIDFSDPVVANPNDFSTLLTPQKVRISQKSMHTFRFSRQKGSPHVCYFSGEYFDVKPLSQDELELTEQDLLYLSQIKSFFGLFAGEIVFFKEKGKFIFGSVNHYYDQAASFPGASEILVKGMNDFASQFKERNVV